MNLKKEASNLTEMMDNHRKSMDKMTNEINEKHEKDTQELQFIMKDFYTKLKDRLYGKKNENYQLVRELQQLEREKVQMHQQAVFSSNRIKQLEKEIMPIDPSREDEDSEMLY